MDEYIKRAEALEITTRTCGDYAAAWSEIRKLPAADVVEVVRCRDCKYGTSVWSGSVLCGHPEYDLLEGVLAYEADHFCSYGQKKETTQSLRP